jgi:hypothetical protein
MGTVTTKDGTEILRPDLPVPNNRREISQAAEARNPEILFRLAAPDAHHPRRPDQRRSAHLHRVLKTIWPEEGRQLCPGICSDGSKQCVSRFDRMGKK